jgi:uncharacterized membrane protein
MLELILLIIAILCLFSSAETSVAFLVIAVGVLAYKRRGLYDEVVRLHKALTDLSQNVHRNAAKLEKLSKELAELRASGSVIEEVRRPEAPTPIVQPETRGPMVAPPTPAAKPTPPQVPVEIEKPATPVEPVLPKPITPAAVVPPRTEIPDTPRDTVKSTPPLAPPVEWVPASPSTPPRSSASYQVPPPRSELKVPKAPRTPAKPIAERLKSVFALEEVLGKNWLNKLGIVLLVLGMALLGIHQFSGTPAGKTILFLLGSAVLLGGGIFLERKERYQLLGRAGIGGGWALLFFTTYAVHHVQAMLVLPSETLDLVLMLAVAVAMALHTLRYKSQVVTGLAFLLAYSTIALSHDTVYALSAGAALAIGLVIIAVRMQWYELEIFGILSSYLNHFYWLYKILGPEGANHHAFPQFYASTVILLVYWTAYRISYIVRRISTAEQESISSIAAVFNTLFLLGVMKFQSVHPELAFYALLILGVLELGFGQLPITRRRRNAFVLLSIIGASLMILAVPFKFAGNNVAILWFIGAEAFLAAGILQKELLFRRIGLITGILVGFHVLLIDCTRLYQARMLADQPVIAGGILLLTCGLLFYLNAHYVFKKWPTFFLQPFDRTTLSAHSYFGAITVTLAAWALFVLDWTAVAWIAIVVTLGRCARYLRANDLFLQASAIGVLVFFRMFTINLHLDQMSGSNIVHIVGRYVTVPIIAAGFYLAAHFVVWEKKSFQVNVRHLFAWAGTIALGFLIWGEVSYRWQPLALVGFALILAEASLLLKYAPLTWHVHLLTLAATANAILYEEPIARSWHLLNKSTLVIVLTAIAAYWLAKRVSSAASEFRDVIRDSYTWVGSFLVAWLIWRQLPDAWIAVAWLAFGVALTLIGRRWNFAHLCYQENVLAALAVIALAWFNYPLAGSGVLNLRLLTVVICAAGFYGVSRLSTPAESEHRQLAAYLHTWAATSLLAILAWYEAPNPWLAVIWSSFALTLGAVGRRFKLRELPWQAHVLTGLSVIRVLTVNIYTADKFHAMSLRLVTMVLVIAILYALSRVVELSEDLRRRDFHHAYTWIASFLAPLLMWYELQPISVAVAWALFALVLFEIGQLRDIRQIRLQAYAGLIASFVRIFFVNLSAGTIGELLGPRMTTVAPLALIYFFVYSQMKLSDKSDSRWSMDTILAYVGSLTIASLLYFQVPGGWIATAWSVMVFCLLGTALLLDREVFLHQGLLLSLAAFSRGVMHNLFGASYFSDGTWTGRYLELGSAVLALLAALPLAMKLKNKYLPEPGRGKLRNLFALLSSRPEQVMFFVPILLLTLMLALKMRSGMVTVAWGIEGVFVILLALVLGERSFRLSGLVLLLLCVGKIMLIDAWQLQPRDRYVTFIILGLALLGVSFLYSKYREAINQFL